ncbi:ABC transporter [Actinomyces oricola]
MASPVIVALVDADRRRLSRDGLLAWVSALPLVMAAAARAGLPQLVAALGRRGIDIGPWLPRVQALAFAVVVPLMIGVVVGFMLLEEKQDRVWQALAVTRVSLRRYLAWRAVTCLGVAVVVTLAGLLVGGPTGLTAAQKACLAAGAAPLAGMAALALAAWTHNTIEGFAVVKLAFAVLVLPVAAPVMGSPWRELLALLPSWWVLRAAEAMQAGEGWQLLVIGAMSVNLVLMGAAAATAVRAGAPIGATA